MKLEKIGIYIGAFCSFVLFQYGAATAIETATISFANCSSSKADIIMPGLRSHQDIESVTLKNAGNICRFVVQYSGGVDILRKSIESAFGTNFRLSTTHVSNKAIRFLIKDIKKTHQKSDTQPNTYDVAQTQQTLEIQRLLTELGFKPGPIDGVLGEQTMSAIKVFQQKLNLPITGAPSSSLLKRLKADVNTINIQPVRLNSSEIGNSVKQFPESSFTNDYVLLSSPTLSIPYYESPNIYAVKKGVLPAGTAIAIHRKIDEFIEVSVESNKVYIHSSFCKRFYRK